MRHARKSNSSMPRRTESTDGERRKNQLERLRSRGRFGEKGTQMSSHQPVVLDAGVSGMSASTTSKSDLLDIHQC